MNNFSYHSQPGQTEEAIVDAFSTYPDQPTPTNFSAGVMARLRALPPDARPRFKLSWFDWALSLFTTGMAGVGLLVWQTLPPQVVIQIQQTWTIWFQHVALWMPH